METKERMLELASRIEDVLLADTTLKAAKENVKSILSEYELVEKVAIQFETVQGCRTKKDFAESVKVSLSNLADFIETGNPELEFEVDVDDKPEDDKLKDLATAIRNEIVIATNSHFKTGMYLTEALEIFKAEKKPAKDWLEWANLECGIKKTQAYDLVKVWTNFGTESDFAETSMRVLNVIVHLKDDLWEAIKDDAASLAREGKLDSKSLDTLIDSQRVEPKEVKQPDNDPDTKVDDNKELPVNEPDKVPDLIKAENDRTAELEKINEELRNQLSELNQRLRELLEEKDAPKVPYLPQFDNFEPYIVLGVSPVASKEEIQAAYRKMAKIFSMTSCPEGADKLKKAKTEMLRNVI
jgi:DNA-binding transcriptional MerR regulator